MNCANCDKNLPFGTLVLLDMTNVFRYSATLVAPSLGSGTTYKNLPFFNVPISIYRTILATCQYFYILSSLQYDFIKANIWLLTF